MKHITLESLQCSKLCGRGRRTRPIQCVDLMSKTRSVVGDNLCSGRKKPNERNPCNKHSCPFVWQTGGWSQVRVSSVTCITTPVVTTYVVISLPVETSGLFMLCLIQVLCSSEYSNEVTPYCFAIIMQMILRLHYEKFVHVSKSYFLVLVFAQLWPWSADPQSDLPPGEHLQLDLP